MIRALKALLVAPNPARAQVPDCQRLSDTFSMQTFGSALLAGTLMMAPHNHNLHPIIRFYSHSHVPCSCQVLDTVGESTMGSVLGDTRVMAPR